MNPDYLKIIENIRDSQHGVNSIWGCSGDANIPLGERICFGGLTKYFNGDKTLDITVVMPKNVYKYGSYNRSYGVTPFTFDEIVQYLNDLKKIFPFDFEIREIEGVGTSLTRFFPKLERESNDGSFQVTYHISGPHIAFMFILSLQRFLYAWVDNFYLAVALEIKNGNYGYEKMNLFNILNCVISTTTPEYRGSDMYHFNPEYFCYLWNSKDLHDMLVEREEAAAKDVYNGMPGVIDLYGSMLYAPKDGRFKRFRISNLHMFPGFLNKFNGEKGILDDLIQCVTENLELLREYNGFSPKAMKRREDIERSKKLLEGDGAINYYTNSLSSASVKKKFDLSKLTT